MDYYSSKIRTLIEELSRLPGIGAKSATRMAFHLINQPQETADRLADAIRDARAGVRLCRTCCTVTDGEECPICASTARDRSTIMVVENPRDLAAYEKTGRYNGLYHVLHGAISPALGIGPSDIKLKELMMRLQDEQVKEVIIATNSTLEGETTAAYLSKLIRPLGILTSRIANGIPVGGDLESIDEVTLLRALEGRRAL
ncbi:MAG: recombination protein RecR [Lachnospiraceae bacterium]|nr:recombination protein RecR [Lachnospiraceae bacterium]